MKRVFMIVLFAIVIALVGCQMNDNVEEQEQATEETFKPKDMEKEDHPDVRAFQDEFTRGFLQSTEETRPGYYPFLSGTGAFEMDFPEEGKLGERSYNIRDSSFEVLTINVGNEQSSILHKINIKYFHHLTEDLHKDSRLGQIQSGVGEDLNFKRVEEDSQVYYISEYERDKAEYGHEVYGYAVLVLNKTGLGGMHIIYTSNCLNDCEKDREQDKQDIYDWIMSVKFYRWLWKV